MSDEHGPAIGVTGDVIASNARIHDDLVAVL